MSAITLMADQTEQIPSFYPVQPPWFMALFWQGEDLPPVGQSIQSAFRQAGIEVPHIKDAGRGGLSLYIDSK